MYETLCIYLVYVRMFPRAFSSCISNILEFNAQTRARSVWPSPGFTVNGFKHTPTLTGLHIKGQHLVLFEEKCQNQRSSWTRRSNILQTELEVITDENKQFFVGICNKMKQVKWQKVTEGCEFGGGKQIGVISSERPRNTKTEEEKNNVHVVQRVRWRQGVLMWRHFPAAVRLTRSQCYEKTLISIHHSPQQSILHISGLIWAFW